MTNLKDLTFKNNGIGMQAEVHFPNGYGASILNGYGYSDKDETYELAVLKGSRICSETYITDDVLGYKTEDEIDEALRQIEGLK